MQYLGILFKYKAYKTMEHYDLHIPTILRLTKRATGIPRLVRLMRSKNLPC